VACLKNRYELTGLGPDAGDLEKKKWREIKKLKDDESSGDSEDFGASGSDDDDELILPTDIVKVDCFL